MLAVVLLTLSYSEKRINRGYGNITKLLIRKPVTPMFTLYYNESYGIYQVFDAQGMLQAVSEFKDYCLEWIKEHTKG